MALATDWGKVNKVKLIWEGTTVSKRSGRLALNRSSHGVIVNRPHLTGVNLGPLITAEESVIIQQDAFSAVATCMNFGGGGEMVPSSTLMC